MRERVCLFCLWGLRVAYSETLEGIQIHIEGRSLEDGVVVMAQICARGDWLQMPDLLERQDRHLGVTLSVLIWSVLRAGARLQRHRAAAGHPFEVFVRHGAWHTGQHMSNFGATDTHSYTREQWWAERAADGAVWGEKLA